MFERLGSWTYRFRFLILIAWVVAAVFMAKAAPSLSGAGSTDQTSFLPANSPSRAAKDALERAFPGSTSSSSATITMDRPGGLTDADRAWRDEYAAWAVSDSAPERLQSAVTDTATADSRPELRELFRGPDGTFELFAVNLDVADAGDDAKAVVELLRAHLADTAPAGLETHVTGAAAISSDYLEAVQVGTDSTTTVTIILVILVLLAIYRAPLAALVPLATIGVAFVVSLGVLGFLAAAGWQVSSTLETFLVVMVFGVGTDYAIFLISRYREEVSQDGDWHDAAKVTVRRIGAVITASAGTVIVGMMAMGVGDFKMITSMGPGIAIAVAVTLAAALTLSPALLSIFGHSLFWPLHTGERHEGEPHGFFAALARAVSRRPVVVTIGLTAVLLVPVLYLPQVNSNFDVLADLPKAADSRIGYEQIGDHLGEDKLVQSTALIDLGAGGDILAPAQLARLHALMEDLHAGGGIATTTSLITPNGDTTVPDGSRPSKTLQEIADGFAADSGTSSDSDNASLLDPEVKNGLDQALDYVNGLAVAFPDAASGLAWREARDGLEHAIDIVGRVEKQSVVSTQLRALATSITDPANAATSTSGSEDSSPSTLMSDYLVELGTAFPEVKSLTAYKDGLKAARALESDASIAGALTLSDSLAGLADYFDGQPGATLSPKSLAGTASAKAFRQEAESTFNALPSPLTALAAVFATRSDDFYLPMSLTGDDAQKLQDAIDAFVSRDRTATRFYLTSSNAPYSGGAFGIIKEARAMLRDGAAAFGPGTSGHIGGPTAQFTDVQDTLADDFLKVGAITVLGILIVLMLLLRAVVAPLYLVVTVLVSYGSTLGVSGFVFQELLGHHGVSPYLPLIVFVLLVALGSDYNIFLMHRIREEAETLGMKDAVRTASGHTGAVITSAGLILAGTFGSMAIAPLTMLVQVGVAVAIGVLIDTFLVRSILVPAITTIAGDRAWWPSGFRAGGAVPVPVAEPVPLGVPEPTGVPVGAALGAAIGPAAGASLGATRLSRRALIGAIALIVLIPVMVAGLLTWSIGSQGSDLSSMRAVVVNLDEGGDITAPDGTRQSIRLGDDLAASLTGPDATNGFTWEQAAASDAASGLDEGRYAAVLTVPQDFSRSVAALRADPTGRAPKASLRLATSDASDATTGTVAKAVMAAIVASTSQGITASYVDDVLLATTQARAGFAGAAGSANDVAGAASGLADGAAGVGTVASELASGLQQLADGATSAQMGTDKLVRGTAALAGGVRRLAEGADGLASGTQKASDGADLLAVGATSMADGMGALEMSTADLPKQADALATGAEGVATGATAVEKGATQLSDGLDTMARQTEGLSAQTAALDSGASGVAAGSADLWDGTKQVDGAAESLAAHAAQLDGAVTGYTSGVAVLSADCTALGGTDPLCSQLAALAASGPELTGASGGVASGASQLAGATGRLTSGAKDLSSGASLVAAGTAQLSASTPALVAGIDQSAAGASDLAAGSAQVASGADSVSSGARRLADGTPALTSGIAQLSGGADGLAKGTGSLASGLRDLASGADQLATGAQVTAAGASKLASGTSQAADGAGQLTNAMQQVTDVAKLVEAQAGSVADAGTTLTDEAADLASSLEAAAGSMHSYAAETRGRMGELAANPVIVETDQRSVTRGSDGGYAPFFLSLAIWLGALGAFLVLPGLWWNRSRGWVGAVLAAFAAAALLVGVGAVLAALGLQLLAGVEVAQVAQSLFFAGLAAATFVAIVQTLVVLLGQRGWLLALLFLVVQVAAVGFYYPGSTMPGLLAVLRIFMPMTYAVDALRGAIIGVGSSPGIDMVVLAGWFAAAMPGTLVVAAGVGRRETRRRLEQGANA